MSDNRRTGRNQQVLDNEVYHKTGEKGYKEARAPATKDVSSGDSPQDTITMAEEDTKVSVGVVLASQKGFF